MPTSLATLLTFIFMFVLYAWDHRRHKDASRALWLPVLWIVPAASRFPSQWLLLGDPNATANVSDGSTIDAVYFSILIALGTVTLIRRRIVSAELFRRNFWFIALLVFGLLSILWSDFQFIAMKRWIKTLGHPVMALLILTDVNPINALRIVMRRCAFLLLPLSVLFIKYLPEYGRYFNQFGQGMYRGAMITKNELGVACVFFGLFFLWRILARKEVADLRLRREEVALSVVFLVIVVYLIAIADSAASLVNLTIGSLTLIGLGLPIVSRRFFVTYFVTVVVVVLSLELTFGLYAQLIEALGRDPTLTDRTEVWADCLALQTRPLIGMGFESFWLGDRLEAMWAQWWWRPNQAHNGYIETYLNLGLIGLGLLAILIVSSFRRVAGQLRTDFELSRFRLALLFTALAYNVTEATFKGVALTWTMFHLFALVYPRPEDAAEKAQRTIRRPYGRRAKDAPEPVADAAAAKHGQAAQYRSRMR